MAERTFTIPLSEAQLQVVFAGLGNLPYNQSAQVIGFLTQFLQAQEQQQAQVVEPD